MEKIIIVKPDDTVGLTDYTGYESLKDVVGGNIEHFFSFDLPVLPAVANGKESLKVDLYCNEEFLVSDNKEFDKINAVASLMTANKEGYFTEIRGNVAMVVYEGDGVNRGFEYKEYSEIDGAEPEEDLCECWSAEDTVLKFISANQRGLQELHQRFDNNKSKPQYEIHHD